jgi:hypothetical protein
MSGRAREGRIPLEASGRVVVGMKVGAVPMPNFS